MLRFEDVRSANAPAAMYFVISVLPSSITSGALLPARAASNFVRWSFQVWYSTLTSVPGWLASKLLARGVDGPFPVLLGVDLQPDAQGRGLRRMGRRRARRDSARRRNAERERRADHSCRDYS